MARPRLAPHGLSLRRAARRARNLPLDSRRFLEGYRRELLRRDYDFLNGDGGLLLNMALAGLRDSYTATKPDFEKVFPLESELSRGYPPPASILKIAREPEYVFESKWDLAAAKSAIATAHPISPSAARPPAASSNPKTAPDTASPPTSRYALPPCRTSTPAAKNHRNVAANIVLPARADSIALDGGNAHGTAPEVRPPSRCRRSEVRSPPLHCLSP